MTNFTEQDRETLALVCKKSILWEKFLNVRLSVIPQNTFFVGEILECAPERDPCFYFFGLFETVVKRILIKKVHCLSKFPSAVFNI